MYDHIRSFLEFKGLIVSSYFPLLSAVSLPRPSPTSSSYVLSMLFELLLLPLFYQMSLNLTQYSLQSLTSFPHPLFKIHIQSIASLSPRNLRFVKLFLLNLQASGPMLVALIWRTMNLVVVTILLKMGVDER